MPSQATPLWTTTTSEMRLGPTHNSSHHWLPSPRNRWSWLILVSWSHQTLQQQKQTHSGNISVFRLFDVTLQGDVLSSAATPPSPGAACCWPPGPPSCASCSWKQTPPASSFPPSPPTQSRAPSSASV